MPRYPYTPKPFIPRRKPTRGVLLVSAQPTIVFVTVCTQGRRPWLATPEHHEALMRLWRDEATAWLVGRYTLMPDHVHFFASLAEETCTLNTWMRYWKRRFRQVQGLPSQSLQEGMWDTRMRSAKQYEEKWEYVRNNPVRHGLVARAGEWPYSGEVHLVGWPGGAEVTE